MHKESLVVSPNKPRAAARSAPIKSDLDGQTINHVIHSRLPSTDSGIQADGGFDSLSRYKGETFLSSYASDRLGSDTSDRLGADVGPTVVDNATFSYKGSIDFSQASFPSSPKYVPPPSRSSKPIPPQKPTLTSSPSKSASPRPAPRSAHITATSSTPLASETSNGRNVARTRPTPPTTADQSPARSSATPRQPAGRPFHLNQNVPASKPVAVERKDPGIPTIQPRHSVSSSNAPNLDATKMPNTTGKPTESDVEVSISKNVISISSLSSTSDNSIGLSTSGNTSTILDLDPSLDYVKVIESSTRGTSSNLSSSSEAALNLQTSRPSAFGRNQQEKKVNEGQGSIALTRPLRLGVPSKLNVKTIHATTLSPQPSHLVPVMKTPQQQGPKPQETTISVKPKPRIAPRPPALTKTPQSPLPIVSSTISITTFSGTPSSTNTTTTSATLHKPEVPVVHRIKVVDSEKTEIPVIHVVHRSTSQKKQNLPRPPSLVGRHTPDRDRFSRQLDYHLRQPIYENIRSLTRNDFLFDDADSRMKHADLILKHSDELISEAMKLLTVSPQSTQMCKENGSVLSSNNFSGVHAGDGEHRQPIEHRIPVLDARTGKLYSGSRKSYLAEWVSANSGEDKNGVTWSERKERIDTALSWLQHELADLRQMDTNLISQFQRCQETIETLKNQRESWDGLSEEGEECEYWEDYELNEYNRRYLDSPGGSSCSHFSPGSRQLSLQDVTLTSLSVHQDSPTLDSSSNDRQQAAEEGRKTNGHYEADQNSPTSPGQHGFLQGRKASLGQHSLTQDIEVTL